MPTKIATALFARSTHGLVDIEIKMRGVRIIRIEYTRVHARVIYQTAA